MKDYWNDKLIFIICNLDNLHFPQIFFTIFSTDDDIFDSTSLVEEKEKRKKDLVIK